MSTAKFKLDSVTIEGFKTFASEQNIQISGKNLFLFGENGSGKSSVVEAIRWCLFGLAERPDTEVRNTFYAKQECHVELRLKGPAGIYKLSRRLRPGIGSGRSDLTITTPDNKAVSQSTLFPHMARLGPREGTHIIFAAQQAQGRRPQADISDFDKVLYSYLQLEDIPDLLERLDKILEEQRESERQIASDISELEETLRR